jgi:hypothetical protein
VDTTCQRVSIKIKRAKGNVRRDQNKIEPTLDCSSSFSAGVVAGVVAVRSR